MTDCSVITVGDVFIKANKRNSDGRIKNVITNSAEYGLIPQRDFFDKDIAVDGNTNNYYIIHKDCFVYNPRKSNTAPYGPFNCYNGEEEGIISPLYTCLIKKIEVDSTYLSWYFKSDSWYRYIYDNGSQGVRHDRVSMTDDLLMGIPVKLPSAQKQKEISKFLNGIDAKLRLEADILKHLIKIKNGLYDKMFL
jgi:type I restriction enzyme S subunit